MVTENGNVLAASVLLAHYFRTIYKQAGLSWTDGNETEVRDIAKLIYDAAREECKRDFLSIQGNLNP